MHPRERFDYTSPFRRPPLKTDDGTRLIIWPVVNIEEWEIDRPCRAMPHRRPAA